MHKHTVENMQLVDTFGSFAPRGSRVTSLSHDSTTCAVPVHERLSEAGETVFILRERRGERASELISSDRDLEKANFHRNIDELSTHLTRLRVYFENMADYLK